MEAEKQLSDKKAYQEVSNSENILSKLVEMGNRMFSSLKKMGYITEEQLNIFPANMEKFISFHKIIKGYIISQHYQLLQIVVYLQKNALRL